MHRINSLWLRLRAGASIFAARRTLPESVRRLDIATGDVIVFTFSDARAITKSTPFLRAFIGAFPGVRVVALHNGIDLAVMRGDPLLDMHAIH